MSMTTLIAHRGASFEYPENTMLSIKKAIEFGAPWIEIDIRLSKDGIPIVIHDHNLERTSNRSCVIHDLTCAELKTIDVGSHFNPEFFNETIPTLEEVLLLKRNACKLMLELKESPNEELLCYAIKDLLLKTNTSLDSIILGSFSLNIIDCLQKILPQASLIGIVEDEKAIPYHLERQLSHLALWHPLLNQSLVEHLESQNVKQWAFTVDDQELAKSLTKMNVQGIITNHLRMLQSTLKYS